MLGSRIAYNGYYSMPCTSASSSTTPAGAHPQLDSKPYIYLKNAMGRLVPTNPVHSTHFPDIQGKRFMELDQLPTVLGLCST